MAPDPNQRISEVVARERSRLWSFIRRRVPDSGDAEDILQDVFHELVEANRLLMPIEHVTGWLYRVARNRIVDLFRKTRTVSLDDTRTGGEESLRLEEYLPSPEAGPEARYWRMALIDELEDAIDALPEEQREVFLAHEIEGVSFADLSRTTGVNVNTLLSRKRYAVLRLRERLQRVYDEFRQS